MSNFDWWEKHDSISRLQGYSPSQFQWSLNFKPQGYYLGTQYNMNTTCWYVHVEAAGYIDDYCAGTAKPAVIEAIAETIKKIEIAINSWINNPTSRNPSQTEIQEWQDLLEKLKQLQ